MGNLTGVRTMLWLLSAMFLLVWLAGFLNGYTMEGFIHALLVFAIVAFVFGVLTRRKSPVS